VSKLPKVAHLLMAVKQSPIYSINFVLLSIFCRCAPGFAGKRCSILKHTCQTGRSTISVQFKILFHRNIEKHLFLAIPMVSVFWPTGIMSRVTAAE